MARSLQELIALETPEAREAINKRTAELVNNLYASNLADAIERLHELKPTPEECSYETAVAWLDIIEILEKMDEENKRWMLEYSDE